MDDYFFVLGFGLVGLILIGSILGIVATVQATRLKRDLWQLRRTVGDLSARLNALGETAQAPPATDAPMTAPAAPPPPAAASPRPPAPTTAATPTSATDRPPPPRPPAMAPPPAARAAGFSFEENLTSKWMVWLGGVALALGAVFLVVYAINEGYFGPGLRVASGLVLGAILIGAGEWVRRHPALPQSFGVSHDYVPQALTAAGLVAGFAAIYAAHALYAMIGFTAAFAALAVLAFAAIALALLQGPFVAILGLLGGYVTPLLVDAPEPNAWALFAYLIAITAASVGIVRYVAAWWLSWSALAGAAIWAGLWILPRTIGLVGTVGIADWIIPFGLYIIAVAALFQWVRSPAPQVGPAKTPGLQRLLNNVPLVLTWTATIVFALFSVALVDVANWRFESLILLSGFAAATVLFAIWDDDFAAIALVALAVTALAVSGWPLPFALAWAPGQSLSPDLVPFIVWSLIYGVAFAGIGYWALWRSKWAGVWACLSGLAPLLFLGIAYWRVTAFETSLMWSFVALLLALLGIVVTAQVNRRPSDAQADAVIGFYAAATVAAFSFCFTMALEEAWLTVALSAQLPVLAWIANRRHIAALAPIAGAVALVVLIRLIPNIYVLDYQLAGTLGIPWVIYGYGLPALAFYFARTLFANLTVWPDLRVGGTQIAPAIRGVLEAGAIMFATMLVSFVIRLLMEGRLDAPSYSFAEQGLQQAAWATLAAALWWLNRGPRLVVPAWAWRILLVLSAIHLLFGPALDSNPLWTAIPVGEMLIINLLFLAFAVPAGFAFFFGSVWRREGAPMRALISNIAGLGLAFAYLMMEVRHFHHGPVLAYGTVGDAELYTYSAVMLVFAIALLGIGLWRDQASARYASLAFMGATVVKVFLIDMSALTGLYRAVSFIGLGLALLAIGRVYQLYVLPPRRQAEGGDDAPVAPDPTQPAPTAP